MAQNSERDHPHLAPDDELPPQQPVSLGKLTSRCHCGRISVEMPSHPSKVNECRCSICYRYGALWSYFPRDDVKVVVNVPTPASHTEGIMITRGSRETSQGAEDRSGLQGYVRSDGDSDGRVGFFFCKHCGCLTHWDQTEKGLAHLREQARKPKVGVNCRMLPPRLLDGVEKTMGKVGDF